MNAALCLLLAVFSIWDYPSRQAVHERLVGQLSAAVRSSDARKMESVCRQGVALLPDDPVWHYNLACALAHGRDTDEMFDMLERAVDLGFRDVRALEADSDFRAVATDRRFRDLVAYARRMRDQPVQTGPFSAVAAIGGYGHPLVLGAHNLSWNYDFGSFEAKIELTGDAGLPHAGDLYMNRDAGHSVLGSLARYPGLTVVSFDAEGREREADVNAANTLFPCPVFGNCSRAFTRGPLWRSLPRSLMTGEARRMKQQHRLYVTNQVWVYPACDDFGPAGTNGDVFASVTPYWIVTSGRSWSDLPYVDAALAVSASLPRPVKAEIVRRGLLAPTVQALLRKSLKSVGGEDDYLTPLAHPTCFAPGAVDLDRLRRTASELTLESIPPLAHITAVASTPVAQPSELPELTYATPCAWAFVLRAAETNRSFLVRAAGGRELRFAVVHDEKGLARVEQNGQAARVSIDRSGMSPTNRIDVAVFARNEGTLWGAPAFVSFAVVDASAPYSDPLLTRASAPAGKVTSP